MTALEVTAVAVIMLAGPLLVGWWGYREGFRQGDELGDPTADVRLFPHSEEGSTVRVHLMNPAAHPVVVSIDARLCADPGWPRRPGGPPVAAVPSMPMGGW